MVAEASGCWAREGRAVATARPSARAGPIVPKPVVTPAITIDATAMTVVWSMGLYFFLCWAVLLCCCLVHAGDGCRMPVNGIRWWQARAVHGVCARGPALRR